ncbi:MAG: hypothetical protein NWF07_15145 [Candidatus Bathyarchaeota archaeon]|nr:hypothetical protein [Candidatus Bathyarchaeota archaeon]
MGNRRHSAANILHHKHGRRKRHRSTGTITITGPCGTQYDAGDYETDQAVAPGEYVEVPVTWVSTGGVPGVYGVILDGQLVYANGESETTHSVVSEAFMLYEPLTGLDFVPGIVNDASLTGITMISDTFSTGGIFMNIVWINNTGTTSFIPEIFTTFTDNETTYGPYTTFYLDDPCTPGLHPYTYMCQLPIIMNPGRYEYSTQANMHYPATTDEEMESSDLGPFWTDAFTIETYESNWFSVQRIHSIPDGLSGELVIGADVCIQRDTSGVSTGFYDIGMFAVHSDPELNIPKKIGNQLGLPFYKNKDGSLTPEEADYLENNIRPRYTPEQYQALSEIPEKREWTEDPVNTYEVIPGPMGLVLPEGFVFEWKPLEPIQLGVPHKIMVKEPEVDFTAEAEVNTPPSLNNPLGVTVTLDNNGELVFKPSFEVEIENADGEKVETETTNKDDDKKVKPLTQETFELEIQTPQTFTETGETEWIINIRINSGDTYIPTLKGIPDGDYTEWLTGTLSGEGTQDLDDDFEDLLEDDPYLTSENFWFDIGLQYEFDYPSSSSETDTSDDSTQDTTTETTDTPTDTETQEEQEENNETEQEKGILQSIIDSIVNFFKGLFG